MSVVKSLFCFFLVLLRFSVNQVLCYWCYLSCVLPSVITGFFLLNMQNFSLSVPVFLSYIYAPWSVWTCCWIKFNMYYSITQNNHYYLIYWKELSNWYVLTWTLHINCVSRALSVWTAFSEQRLQAVLVHAVLNWNTGESGCDTVLLW